MTNYTDAQLRQAVLNMPRNHRADYIHDWELKMFREFLDHLPDQYPTLEAAGQPHDYQTLKSAIHQAADEHPTLRGLDAYHLAKILSYLPDQQDDWQECEFSEIRKGDRVKVVDEYGEKVYDEPVITTYVGPVRAIRTCNCHVADQVPEGVSFLRIPAPVVHPDPEVCKHIIVYETTRQTYGEANREYPSFHYSWDDDLWRGDISTVLESWEILEWDYAKVVIDND